MPSLDALQRAAGAKAAAEKAAAAPPAIVPSIPGAASPGTPDLRTAQAEVKQAADAEAAAAALVMEADAHVAGAREARTRFDGLAARATRAIADRLKARDRTPLPAELAEARRAGLDADQALAEAEAVAALLCDEHRTTALELEVARGRLAAAVDTVMQQKAVELVGRMRAAEAEAGRLRGLALGVMTSRPISAPPVSWDVAQLTHEPVHPFLMESAGPGWKDSGRAWNAFRDALLTDADAVGPA